MCDCFLECFDRIKLWVKYMLAKVCVDEVLEPMVMFLNVLPNGIGKLVFHQADGKSDVG